jgi:hypothetical protein
LRAGFFEQALIAARDLRSFYPDSQYAVAYEVAALRLLGDETQAANFYDYDRFIHQTQLSAPDGFADLEVFNRQLAADLDIFHTTDHAPIYQTLNFGTQSHQSLFTRANLPGSVMALGEAVMQAAKLFSGQLPDGPTHPFLSRKSQRLLWSGSWSVRLHRGGFHNNHIHDEGWLSGCYYVETPDCLADEINQPGWITFGGFSQPSGRQLPHQRSIRPFPGLLVLFPSYMWHGTLPITGDQPRLTVAFDIRPV